MPVVACNARAATAQPADATRKFCRSVSQPKLQRSDEVRVWCENMGLARRHPRCPAKAMNTTNSTRHAPTDAPSKIVLDDDANAKYWREHFGATQEQLQEAVLAVGDDPARVHEHLLRQGASAGPG